MKKPINRRDFIKTTAIAGATATMIPNILFGMSSQKLKLGIIGTGFRGQWMARLFLDRPDIDIPVICDIDDRMIEMVLAVF